MPTERPSELSRHIRMAPSQEDYRRAPQKLPTRFHPDPLPKSYPELRNGLHLVSRYKSCFNPPLAHSQHVGGRSYLNTEMRQRAAF